MPDQRCLRICRCREQPKRQEDCRTSNVHWAETPGAHPTISHYIPAYPGISRHISDPFFVRGHPGGAAGEKAGYQTRVVGASDPFHWSSISRSGRRWDDEWKRVVVSREWPPDPQVQRMLRELPAMDPLYLVERRDWEAAGAT